MSWNLLPIHVCSTFGIWYECTPFDSDLSASGLRKALEQQQPLPLVLLPWPLLPVAQQVARFVVSVRIGSSEMRQKRVHRNSKPFAHLLMMWLFYHCY